MHDRRRANGPPTDLKLTIAVNNDTNEDGDGDNGVNNEQENEGEMENLKVLEITQIDQIDNTKDGTTENQTNEELNESDTAEEAAAGDNASEALTSPVATAAQISVAARVPLGAPNNYGARRSWITTERMNELRRKAQEAVKQNKTFTIRGCFISVRNALLARGWVEKLDMHRKNIPSGICQVTYDDLAQGLPKRKPGETRRQYIGKCERNIMSRFLEHMPIDFLWTNRKEKCDYIDQAKNPGMVINKFHRAPFTSKEGLCSQLKDFHWFYEEGTAEMYFPRCFNVWSPEELGEFVENFKLTACIAFLRWIIDTHSSAGAEGVFSPFGKIPITAIDFAYKRLNEFIDSCQHNDIDCEDPPRVWEHDWDAFLYQHYQMTNEDGRILSDQQRLIEHVIRTGTQLLENLQPYWPQFSLDGYRNLWIIKPANKCRGRGIQLMDNLKKIMNVINPSIASKSRYVVQKYIERPLIIHSTKFDIRQWFLITNVQPLVVWMYKESYLRFSSQEYSLTNHHESVHLTNHAVQKKYTNGKRDKRLPNENMWDCYSFQAYLRQIGKQDMWLKRIFPGMRKAIVGTMLASQENMDRRPNTFELFGADFMICENFYPWLIEINSSPDLGATTSVTARMCPQCLEDVIKVVIDRRGDVKADLGNFELAYRQVVPPTPAYMGLNLFVKGKQLISKVNNHHQHSFYYHHQRKERSISNSQYFRQRSTLVPTISNVYKPMPMFNATEYVEKCIETLNSSRSTNSGLGAAASTAAKLQLSPMHGSTANARQKLATSPAPSNTTTVTSSAMTCPNLLRATQTHTQAAALRRRSYTTLTKSGMTTSKNNDANAEAALCGAAMKRHRSCGPRLPSNVSLQGQAGEGERKFKFIIRKCGTLKTADRTTIKTESDHGSPMPAAGGDLSESTEQPSASKSESNLMAILRQRGVSRVTATVNSQRVIGRSKSEKLLTSSNPSQPSVSLKQGTSSQSCRPERKSCRRIGAGSSRSARLSGKQSSIATATPHSIEGENAEMHAVGKGIGSSGGSGQLKSFHRCCRKTNSKMSTTTPPQTIVDQGTATVDKGDEPATSELVAPSVRTRAPTPAPTLPRAQFVTALSPPAAGQGADQIPRKSSRNRHPLFHTPRGNTKC